MSSDDFVENFISECLEQGITNMADICNKAIEKRDEIDAKLEEIQPLREQRENLQKVLRSLNHNESKRGRRNLPPMINASIGNDDGDITFQPLLIDICNVINNATRPLTSREIVTQVGWDKQDPTPIFMGIKYLFERGILKRNNDRAVGPGENWDYRPKG